jgi:hypothetical protein
MMLDLRSVEGLADRTSGARDRDDARAANRQRRISNICVEAVTAAPPATPDSEAASQVEDRDTNEHRNLVAERSSFSPLGVLRSFENRKGRRHDVVVFSLVLGDLS